ncbi:hypothetical protein IAT38_007136 [Cryptococcus sp. DSM 104549]
MNTRSLLSGRHITFPHPSLEVPGTTTRLHVRTAQRIPSVVHAYTILRAIERKLNTSVLYVQMIKNPDTLTGTHSLFLETIIPVKVDDQMMLEVPAPVLSEESNFLGGPSLEDVRAALAVAADARPSDAPLISSKRNDSLAPPFPRRDRDVPQNPDVIQIQVSPTYEKRAAYRDPKVWQTRNRQGGTDLSRVLQAIQAFDGGFFGGFNGIVDGPRLEARNYKLHNLDQGNGGRGKRGGPFGRQRGNFGGQGGEFRRRDNDRSY